MSNLTRIAAAAAFLAVAAGSGFASAQADAWLAPYSAGAPGPYRPHPPTHVRVPYNHAGPADGTFQGSAGAAYQLGGAQ